MLVIATYDVADSKRLAKIAKIMEDYGTRVQYSVFEIHADISVLEEIMRRVSREIKNEEDSVRLYPLCKNCEKKLEVIGNPVYTVPQDDVVIY